MDDIFEGNWKQIHGHVKEWWGDLTDDDVTRIEGKRENLAGLLQKKYGYTKDRANAEIDKHMEQFKQPHT